MILIYLFLNFHIVAHVESYIDICIRVRDKFILIRLDINYLKF
jgi:hypothetical protein